jgi:hypothetical protein
MLQCPLKSAVRDQSLNDYAFESFLAVSVLDRNNVWPLLSHVLINVGANTNLSDLQRATEIFAESCPKFNGSEWGTRSAMSGGVECSSLRNKDFASAAFTSSIPKSMLNGAGPFRNPYHPLYILILLSCIIHQQWNNSFSHKLLQGKVAYSILTGWTELPKYYEIGGVIW